MCHEAKKFVEHVKKMHKEGERGFEEEFKVNKITIIILIIYNYYIPAGQSPPGLAARAATRTCRPVTTRAGSKGRDSNLPASHHQGWQQGLRLGTAS